MLILLVREIGSIVREWIPSFAILKMASPLYIRESVHEI